MQFSKIKLQQVKEKNFNYNSKKIKSTFDVVKLINDFEELNKLAQEVAILICLNPKGQVIAYSEIARGGTNYCDIDIKSIFKVALLCNATGFILVHNHPSGDVKASWLDKDFTKSVIKASEIMKIRFIDHIIIGSNGFKSCMNNKDF